MPRFFVKIQVLLGFLCCFYICIVDFAETLYQKFWQHLLITSASLLLGQLSVDKQDSDGFFSSRLVCRTSNSSYNSTDSSLVTVDYQQSFVASDFLYV